MKKIINSENGRLILGFIFAGAYIGLLALIMNPLGLKMMIIPSVIALLASCYTLKAIDAYYEAKDKGKSFKEAWRCLSASEGGDF